MQPLSLKKPLNIQCVVFSLMVFTIFFFLLLIHQNVYRQMFHFSSIADSISRLEKQVLGVKGPGGGAGGGHKGRGVGHQAAEEIGQRGRQLSQSRHQQA